MPATSTLPPQVSAKGIPPDAAALSAGVRSVLGSDPSTSPDAASREDGASQANEKEASEENALLASSEIPDAFEDAGLMERQSVEARLPVQLDVGIPIRDFRVRSLIALAPGALIESDWGPGEDVPVASADVQLAWSEFEVVDTQLAVRLTRLA